MSEIVKADKRKQLLAYVLFALVVALVIFVQTDYFSELLTVDTEGLSQNEFWEASLRELIHAQILNVIVLLCFIFFAYKFVLLGVVTLTEQRFPPVNHKVAFDTKVIKGRKAKVQAYFMFFAAFVLLITPIFRSYFIYLTYVTLDEAYESIVVHEEQWNRYRQEYIEQYPDTPQSAYFVYKQGDSNKARRMINTLIEQGDDEALFAKYQLNLKSELFELSQDESVRELDKLCEVYIQPCLFLADYYIDLRDFDSAFSSLLWVQHIDHFEIYSKFMWLYSVNSWHRKDKAKAAVYADLISDIPMPDCDEKTMFSLTKYESNKAD
ncbi:hypothetical protein Ssed_2591 [Shewanella sediminis HAW-EB3]|uniref:Uncharacterized protein n=1 Tax=Shewanella sediminis (strain HAW-EB3) TaxID=425104 RepID=A8FWH5_SHESH|nr:hypothetical protein [Shewanella sediminis]ABV37198.1 hypothetical protein Ssed_2591 [Shewanella sediminis HAW-EB3]